MTDYLIDERNYDLRATEAAAAAGLEFMLFDSEPNWQGSVCRCKACEEAWKEFLEYHGISPRTLAEVWKRQDAKYLKLLQQFWDEFHVKLWSVFRKRMDLAASNWKLNLGIYGLPSPYPEKLEGNRGRFEPLLKAGILDFANPTLYKIPVAQYGSLLRETLRKVPEGTPAYVWSTCGDTSLAYEQTPEELLCQLFMLYLNGAKGAIFYSAYGMDAKKYQTIAEVVRILRPHEESIAAGRIFCVFPRLLLLQSKSLRPLLTGEFGGRSSETQREMRKQWILSGTANGPIPPQNQPQKRKNRPEVRSAENRKNGRPFW